MSTQYLHLQRYKLSGSMGWLGFAPLIFIFAIFYFLLIMPQQRRQKKWQAMLARLEDWRQGRHQRGPAWHHRFH